MSTSDYYKKNPAARKRRNAQQTRYNKSGKGNAIAKRANRANRALGTYGNGDGKDASHKNGKIVGFESQSKNRGRREKSRLKKKKNP